MNTKKLAKDPAIVNELGELWSTDDIASRVDEWHLERMQGAVMDVVEYVNERIKQNFAANPQSNNCTISFMSCDVKKRMDLNAMEIVKNDLEGKGWTVKPTTDSLQWYLERPV